MKNSRFSQKYRGRTCLNCGAKLSLSDKYCPKCGQLNTLKRLSFYDFFYEFFASFISYDSRFYHSIKGLFIRPGNISKAYVEGKRARYVNPFRFYLSVSIVFFILNSFNYTSDVKWGNFRISTENPKSLDEQMSENYYSERKLDSLNFISRFRKRLSMYYEFHEKTGERSADSALTRMDHRLTTTNKWVYRKSVRLASIARDPSQFISYSFAKIPFFLFFFLPIFALFVWLFFRGSHFNYAEHLVFTFHVQTMLFVLFLINTLIGFIIETKIVFLLLSLFFIGYLYKALRNFYKQGRIITVLKLLGLNFIFILLVSITIITAVMTSLAIY